VFFASCLQACFFPYPSQFHLFETRLVGDVAAELAETNIKGKGKGLSLLYAFIEAAA